MGTLHHTEAPVLIAPKDTNLMMHDYQILGTPTYVLISEDGTVQESDFLNRPFESILAAWTSNQHSTSPIAVGGTSLTRPPSAARSRPLAES